MPGTLPPKPSGRRSGGEPNRPREELLGLSKEDKKRSIAIVTYPGVALLDLVATKKVLDDHLDVVSATARGGLGLVAPFIAARPRRLTRQNR